MMIVKSFVLGRESVREIVSLCGKDVIAVVRPEKPLEKMFRDVIRKTVVEKKPAGEDFASIESYFNVLSSDAVYRKRVAETVGGLEMYLSQGMYIQTEIRAVEDYVLAKCARLCAEAVGAETSGYIVDGTELVICRDDAPKPYFDWNASREEIAARLKDREKIIVAGGYGRLGSGYVVRIGRGGANMMASLIASAVGAERIEFWIDKDGIEGVGAMTYDEAAHYCAASVAPFTSAAIWPAKKAGIPIVVKNIDNPDFAGTVISSEAAANQELVSGVLAERGLDLVTVLGTGLLGQVGMSSSIFSCLAAEGVNVRFISQSSSEYSISFAVRHEDSEKVVAAMNALVERNPMLPLDDVMVLNRQVGIVTLFGSRMKNVPGVSGKVFSALGAAGINIIASAQGGEELSISIVVDEADVDKAVAAIQA